MIFWCLSGNKHSYIKIADFFFTKINSCFFYSRLPAHISVPYRGNGLKISLQLLFPKGFSTNFVLITWATFGGLLIHFYLSNFRTMLLMPQYAKPVDSAQDILDRGISRVGRDSFDCAGLGSLLQDGGRGYSGC